MDRARPRHRAMAVLLATLLVPLVAGSAVAAGPKPPPKPPKPLPVAVTTTVSGASVAVDVTVQRGVKEIGSCLYGVDAAPTIACTNRVAVSKKSTAYSINLTEESPGDHAITVTVRHHPKDKRGETGSAAFTIVLGRVFAIAWSNLDGVAGYQSGGTDVLIAKLVDTNGDGVVSVGDTVVGGRYPLDHAASAFGTFGVPSDTVTALHDIYPDTGIGVDVASGTIAWVREAAGEGLLLGFGAGGGLPEIVDIYDPSVDCELQIPDVIFTEPDWALHPDTEAFDLVCDTTDNTFIDVALNLP